MNEAGMQEFYSGQSILITGATGFLGKVLVEKILRKCPNIEMLYLLIRAKKGKDSQERLKDLFKEDVFGPMKKENSDYYKKVTVIVGDVTEPDLGLSESDKNTIIDHVTIVFHGAATVRFDEKLKTAVKINVFGTKQLLNICNKCRNLQAFIHVSTAYANCNRKEIEEIVYAPPIPGDQLISITESMTDDILDKCTPVITNGWPNTYSFTKQVAEDLVKTEVLSKKIPGAIFRPAIVVGSYNEPTPGWVDNIYGPTGLIAGAGAGVLRTMIIDESKRPDLVPVDMTVNAALAAAWDVAPKYRNNILRTGICSDEIPVYNFVSSRSNPLTWKRFLDEVRYYGKKNPTLKAVWYYCGIVTKFKLLFFFYNLFLHILPAFLIDCALLISGRKQQGLKIYRKINKFVYAVIYFTTEEWNFHSDNIKELWSKLPDNDKTVFNFDMNVINWSQLIEDNVKAIRLYIFKDPPDTIQAAKRKMFWLGVLHRIIQGIFFYSIIWFFWPLVLILANLTINSAVFIYQ